MSPLDDFFVRVHPCRIVFFLILVVLICGTLYAFSLGDNIRYPDEEDYFNIVRSLKTSGMYSRDGINPTAYRPPGYPFYLLIVTGGRGMVACRIANMLAFCACLGLLFAIVRREGGATAATCAILIAAFYPLNLYAAGTLFPQSVASFLFLLGLYLYFRPSGLRPWNAVATGIVFGLLLLTVPAFVCVVAILYFAALFERKRHHGTAVALLFVTTLVMLMPWQIRNYNSFGRHFFVSTNSGINLLLGNSKNTRPNSGTNTDVSDYETSTGALDEVERNSYLTQQALNYMKANPARTLTMYVRKFVNYFSYRNELKMKGEQSVVRSLLVLFTYIPIVIVVIIRLLQAHRYPLTRYERYALCLYILNGAFAAVFFTRIRFRIPFDYLMFTLAALQLSRWLSLRNGGQESECVGRATI